VAEGADKAFAVPATVNIKLLFERGEVPGMRNPVEIENIEDMRCQAGIHDVELRQDIRRLEIGDLVLLTLLKGAGSHTGEAWMVRITAIRGNAFQGKLARPVAPGPSRHRAGTRVSFGNVHIHSMPKGRVPGNPS